MSITSRWAMLAGYRGIQQCWCMLHEDPAVAAQHAIPGAP
jgi:hypothetical protein